MGSERRVAPPAVGTVALYCQHCDNKWPLAILVPEERRLWFRERGRGGKSRKRFPRTLLIVGYSRAVLWCDGCGKQTILP
jgi:hypothetical protein